MENFTQVRNEILTMDISAGALRLYMNLLKRCFGDKDTCFPSEETIAKDVKKSVRTVQRYLKELVNEGLIVIKRRGSISNLYIVIEKTNKVIEKKVRERVSILKEKSSTAKSNDVSSNVVESENAVEGEVYDERQNYVEDKTAVAVEKKSKGYNYEKSNYSNANYSNGNYNNINYSKKNYYNNSKKESTFNNFEQRNYDFQKLEAALLGWDKSIRYEECLK